MNWTKAKTALIIMFVLLNIFFLVNILIENNSINSGLNKNQVIEFLRGNNVIIDNIDIKEPKEIIEILYSSNKVELEKIANLSDDEELFISDNNNIVYINKNYENEFDFTSEKIFRIQLEELFNKIGFDINKYIIDGFNEDQNKYTIKLVEKYNDVILYNNNILIEFEGNSLKFIINRFKVSVVNSASVYAEEIKQISIWQILLRYYYEETRIMQIDYGMKIINSDSPDEDKTAILVWRIRENNGLVRYFKISNGEEIEDSF